MNCPSCRQALPSGDERCPSCGAVVAPATEGSLAPDPALRPRVEPLREIPGLRKKERTWKDEVRERVRDRRRQRTQGELPLFADPDELLADEAESSEAMPEDAVDPEAAVVESRLGDAGQVPPARTFALGDEGPAATAGPAMDTEEEPDLPLRPAEPVTPLRGRARFTSVDEEPEEPQPERAPVWEAGPMAEAADAMERPAYVLERFQAAAVDLVILGTLSALVVYFAARAAHVEPPALLRAWPWLAGFVAFLALNYAAYFTGTTGQTVGKMLAGVRVVDADDRRTGYARAMARAALGALGAVVLVGVLPMFLDPARRGLHDRLLRTRVVKR